MHYAVFCLIRSIYSRTGFFGRYSIFRVIYPTCNTLFMGIKITWAGTSHMSMCINRDKVAWEVKNRSRDRSRTWWTYIHPAEEVLRVSDCVYVCVCVCVCVQASSFFYILCPNGGTGSIGHKSDYQSATNDFCRVIWLVHNFRYQSSGGEILCTKYPRFLERVLWYYQVTSVQNRCLWFKFVLRSLQEQDFSSVFNLF